MMCKIGSRFAIVVLATLLMMGGFSVVAYAGGGLENNEPISETTGGYEPQPLTPEGNMTLVDNVEGEPSGDKQFITVVTRNGNYFYIIIDHAEKGENTVHFLNQVDEADLFALMEEDAVATPEPPATCICKNKCIAGAVTMDCPVCSVNMSECTGIESTQEIEPEPTPKESGGIGGILIFVLILALVGGGIFYYFKVLKPKQAVKGNDTLDDFDFEDEEYEEELEGADEE